MSVTSRKGLDNSDPLVYESVKQRELTEDERNEDVVDKFDGREVFGKFDVIYLISIFAMILGRKAGYMWQLRSYRYEIYCTFIYMWLCIH